MDNDLSSNMQHLNFGDDGGSGAHGYSDPYDSGRSRA